MQLLKQAIRTANNTDSIGDNNNDNNDNTNTHDYEWQ